jgi:hypothetical protein
MTDFLVRSCQLSAAVMPQRSYTPAGAAFSCTRQRMNAVSASRASCSARCRCVTCIVTDHASNGVLISRIIGLMDRLRNLKLSKAAPCPVITLY